jgi:hypothetical protein
MNYKLCKHLTILLSVMVVGFSFLVGIESKADYNREFVLNLPFPVGETWLMTSGAHSYSANCFYSGNTRSNACTSTNEGWSALDFSTVSQTIGSVRAMASGIAYNRGGCEVGIQHANGYITRYLHLSNITISNGQQVNVGDQIGQFNRNTLSCGVGTGGHVHVAIWSNKNGPAVQLNIYDFRIGNYQALKGIGRYEGCLLNLNSNQTVGCPGDFNYNGNVRVTNDGIISSQGIATPPTNTRNPNIWQTPKLIRRKGTNQCLNVYKPYNGSKLDTYNCNYNDTDQIFTFEDVGNSQFLLKNQSGFCVNAYLPANYKKINMWVCNRADNDQKFQFDGGLLKSMNNNQCLNGYIPTNYKQLNTFSCNKGDGDQLWELI